MAHKVVQHAAFVEFCQYYSSLCLHVFCFACPVPRYLQVLDCNIRIDALPADVAGTQQLRQHGHAHVRWKRLTRSRHVLRGAVRVFVSCIIPIPGAWWVS